MSRMMVQRFKRVTFCVILGATLLVWAAPPARADIIIPHYFTASQNGRNVELNLILETLWWDSNVRIPRCKVELHRRPEGGEYQRLYRGDLGDVGLDCPEGCSLEERPYCCYRRCRTFVDTCPTPDTYTYEVKLLDDLNYDDRPEERTASILVWPSTGTCEAPPGTVTSNEGCGCGTGLGVVWSHAILALVFGLAVVLGFRKRRSN